MIEFPKRLEVFILLVTSCFCVALYLKNSDFQMLKGFQIKGLYMYEISTIPQVVIRYCFVLLAIDCVVGVAFPYYQISDPLTFGDHLQE